MRKADNLPPSCAVVTNSGNLNFLEPSEPVQACNGTVLPFYPKCFRQVHCPSSGVSQHCIHAVGICRASSVDCLLARSC